MRGMEMTWMSQVPHTVGLAGVADRGWHLQAVDLQGNVPCCAPG